jgi:hypothetical protein
MVVSSCSAFRPRAWPAVDVQFAAGFASYALSEAAIEPCFNFVFGETSALPGGLINRDGD